MGITEGAFVESIKVTINQIEETTTKGHCKTENADGTMNITIEGLIRSTLRHHGVGSTVTTLKRTISITTTMGIPVETYTGVIRSLGIITTMVKGIELTRDIHIHEINRAESDIARMVNEADSDNPS